MLKPAQPPNWADTGGSFFNDFVTALASAGLVQMLKQPEWKNEASGGIGCHDSAHL
jgi:hypothetical protein